LGRGGERRPEKNGQGKRGKKKQKKKVEKGGRGSLSMSVSMGGEKEGRSERGTSREQPPPGEAEWSSGDPNLRTWKGGGQSGKRGKVGGARK